LITAAAKAINSHELVRWEDADASQWSALPRVAALRRWRRESEDGQRST
jgi:hypothetical protein